MMNMMNIGQLSSESLATVTAPACALVNAHNADLNATSLCVIYSSTYISTSVPLGPKYDLSSTSVARHLRSNRQSQDQTGVFHHP